ncbi:hypothetical protein [Serratia rhizosphaerae]|uniref:Uncharacterized protein n=1 Tax=Serratia rhizosphaerae TaxID=2597702 RepID=A0ABX6GJK3_9GAMM|nr:hypothetical protein [Serratia rhizosphaerae]QHA86437.1 hypothetical protein FO014_05320 [Serratia rhizosphaerae]QPT14450.1 hypothetical protein I6G37_05580 [Serratia rubidaea]
MNKLLLIAGLMFTISAGAASPGCTSWPMNMAEVWMKNEKIVDIADIDEAKTESKLLAIEKHDKGEYTQIYHFVFHDKNGNKYEVITQNDASAEECSLSDVNVFLISKSTDNH